MAAAAAPAAAPAVGRAPPTGSDVFGARDRHEPHTMMAPIAGANPWEQYFGPPSHQMVTHAYDKYAYETYDLPEAYRPSQFR